MEIFGVFLFTGNRVEVSMLINKTDFIYFSGEGAVKVLTISPFDKKKN